MGWGAIGDAWDKATDFVDDAVDSAVDHTVSSFNSAMDAAEDAADAMGDFASDVGDAISEASFSDIGHTALDVAGMVPVIGEAADLANAGWYAVEGDYKNAALSAAGAIPFAGNAATAAKWGSKAVDAASTVAKATDTASDVARVADGVGDAAKVADAGADVAKGAETAADGRKTATVYRVDDANFSPRIAADGTVPEVLTKKGNERALFVNVDQPARAKEFALNNRQGNATVTSVEVDASYVEKLRENAVLDTSPAAAANPGAPLVVDVNKAPDQFGLRTPEQIQEFRDAIVPDSVNIIDPGDL